MGYEKPTKIQKETLISNLKGGDLLRSDRKRVARLEILRSLGKEEFP